MGRHPASAARILAAVDCFGPRLQASASTAAHCRYDQAMETVVAEAGRTYDPAVVQNLKSKYVEMESKARQASGNGKFGKDLRVDRQVLPAAGFESGYDSVALRSTAFLNTIGAARQEAQLLFEIAQGMVSSLGLSEMLDHLTKRFRTLVQFDAIAVYLTRGQSLENVYAAGDDAALFRSLHIPVGHGISGWVAENGKPIRNGNPSVEPGYLNDTGLFSIHRSALAVPLEGSSGILGTLALYNRKGDAFTKDDLRVLLAIASKLGLAIENGLRFREAEDTALTDYLTGLPNARALFNRLRDEIGRQREAQGSLVILLADLDGFKAINDTYGHLTGNRVLKAVASTLLHHCREGDLVARMGGDEFVIICPHLPPSKASEFCARLRRAIEEKGAVELGRPLLSASVGIAIYPEDGSEPDQLLAAADRLMYECKELARQRHDAIWDLSNAVVQSESAARLRRRSTIGGARARRPGNSWIAAGRWLAGVLLAGFLAAALLYLAPGASVDDANSIPRLPRTFARPFAGIGGSRQHAWILRRLPQFGRSRGSRSLPDLRYPCHPTHRRTLEVTASSVAQAWTAAWLLGLSSALLLLRLAVDRAAIHCVQFSPGMSSVRPAGHLLLCVRAARLRHSCGRRLPQGLPVSPKLARPCRTGATLSCCARAWRPAATPAPAPSRLAALA